MKNENSKFYRVGQCESVGLKNWGCVSIESPKIWFSLEQLVE